jgi:hypothetical protein
MSSVSLEGTIHPRARRNSLLRSRPRLETCITCVTLEALVDKAEGTHADWGRPYHGGIFAVTAASPARRHYINAARFPPSRRHRRSTAPPVPPPPSCAPTTSHGRATIPAPSLGSIGPPRAACCPGRSIPVAEAEPAAAGDSSAPTSATPRP